VIKALSLTNFRRHAGLDLRFDDDRQLVLIAGGNGVGKTTILEAIQYALWGESRHGRKNLHNLVRRGAELEGMSVEMTFTIGDDNYRVHRRRDGITSTAVLYVNETPVADSVTAVTAEITAVMGMDSSGFKLAVIAQQKDLDGLASLRPAERAKMVTRLLRLDAITSARTEASAIFRKERDLAVALRGQDPQTLEAGITEAETAEADARRELHASQQALVLFDAELAATSDVDAAWQAATQAAARLDGAVKELSSNLDGRRNELSRTVVPDAVGGPIVDIAATSELLADIERRLAAGEAAVRTQTQRQSVVSELERASARLAVVTSDLAGDGPDQAALAGTLESAEALVGLRETELQTLITRLGRAEADVAAAREKSTRAASTDASCGACGQEISDNYRHAQQEQAAEGLTLAQAALDSAQTDVHDAKSSAGVLRQAVAAARAAFAAGRSETEARAGKELEQAELERRVHSYEGQLERIPESVVDVTGLYEEKGIVLADIASAKESAQRERERADALTRRETLRETIERVSEQLTQREAELAAAGPNADLRNRHAARRELLDARSAEAEMAQHWSTEAAIVRERLAAARARQAEAAASIAAQVTHQRQAVGAAAAGRLLADVADRMATQIRPGLESAIATLLTVMSDGRFTSVKVSPDYDILVEDGGQHRALTELSGGEVDLVALATRLALSQVVSDRHGAGGAGFLVLDECFGSQDPQRRSAILDALRTLRETYSQIFLISHVENIEDAADVVIYVKTGEDREETEVVMS